MEHLSNLNNNKQSKESIDKIHRILVEPIYSARIKILILINFSASLILGINVIAQFISKGDFNSPDRDKYYYSIFIPFAFFSSLIELYYYRKNKEPPLALHNFIRIVTALITITVTFSLLHTSSNPPLTILFDAWIVLPCIVIVSLILNRWVGMAVFLFSILNLLLASNNIGFDFVYNSNWFWPVEKPIFSFVIVLIAYYSIVFLSIYFEAGILEKYKKKIPRILNSIKSKNIEADSLLVKAYSELSNLVSSISDIICAGEMIDGKYVMSYLSPQSKKITGYDNSFFLEDPYRLFDCMHQNDIERIKAFFKSIVYSQNKERSINFRFIKKDKSIIWIQSILDLKVYAGKLFLYVTLRDITKEKELEIITENLMQKTYKHSKLLTMGQISANLAHEMNQPLNYINGILQLLLIDAEKNTLNIERSKQEIKNSLHSIQRISAMIKELNKISGEKKIKMQYISLKSVVEDSLFIFKKTLEHKNINFSYIEKEKIPGLYADKNKMEQIFINLLNNSIDALENRENKKITISAKTSSNNIIIEFYDNGCGISEENKEKIFQSFFTTKQASKGTGLGLAIIKTILNDFQADIQCESEENVYTRFIIKFSTANKPDKEYERKNFNN